MSEGKIRKFTKTVKDDLAIVFGVIIQTCSLKNIEIKNIDFDLETKTYTFTVVRTLNADELVKMNRYLGSKNKNHKIFYSVTTCPDKLPQIKLIHDMSNQISLLDDEIEASINLYNTKINNYMSNYVDLIQDTLYPKHDDIEAKYNFCYRDMYDGMPRYAGTVGKFPLLERDGTEVVFVGTKTRAQIMALRRSFNSSYGITWHCTEAA